MNTGTKWYILPKYGFMGDSVIWSPLDAEYGGAGQNFSAKIISYIKSILFSNKTINSINALRHCMAINGFTDCMGQRLQLTHIF